MLIITNPVEAAPNRGASSCSDSDGGIEYDIAGEVTLESDLNGSILRTHFVDSCSGNIVTEYYCRGKNVKNKQHNCSEYCNNGRCEYSPPQEPICGNGIIESGEQCDGSNLNNQSCLDFGFDLGSLSCTNECTFDTSDCYNNNIPDPTCGDGNVDEGEECDGENLLNLTCEDLGYGGGDLSCSDECKIDTSNCTHPPHGPQPPDCSSYPEQRVYIESQAWWWKRLESQTGDNFGHVHVGTCFPHAQDVSGDVNFDVKVVMHNNPGYIHHLGVSIWDDEPVNCYGGNVACQNFNQHGDHSNCPEGADLSTCGLTCPAGETCNWMVPLTVPTTDVQTDGRKEFRFRAFMEQPDGNRLFQSTGWQAYVRNGNPVNDYRSTDMIEARGWYTGAEYQAPRIEKANIDPDDPYSLVGDVSGIWRPEIDIKRGSGGFETDHYIVMIDPAFHADPPSQGVVVKEGTGELNNYQLAIDTTQLTNGWHRLALRADDDFFDATGECAINKGSPCDSTLSALLVIWFHVQN